MTDATPSPRRCLNCGEPLQGRFCHRCGQRDQPRRLPLKALLHDLLHDLWHFDHKVLETVWQLVRRPGFLTREYLQGRRMAWVPPFRLYVFVSFLLFATLSGLHFAGPGAHAKGPAAAPPAKVELDLEGPGGKESPAWARELNARVQRARANPEQYERAFLSNLSKALFLLMPLFAVLLHLVHLRRSSFFVDHMVLSLHHHTLAFLVILALLGLNALPGDGWGLLPGCLLFFAPPFHLAAALRRVHDQGWGRSLAKALLVSGAYGLLLGSALLGLLYLSLPKA